MQQFVTIFVICGSEGKKLFDEANSLLSANGFKWDRESLIQGGHLAFWSSHLDLWSMGDTFDRFLATQEGVVRSAFSSHQLYAMRRDRSAFSMTARNEEEERFLSQLNHAKNAYKQVAIESYLFVIRTVFDGTKGFNPQRTEQVGDGDAEEAV